MNTSRIHNPVINPAFYTSRSVPTAPLDPGTAEFVKGKPAIAQPAKTNAYYIQRLKQHLDDFDRDLAEWKASGEWKKEYKTWGLACEVALGISRQWADRLIKRFNSTTSPELETTVSTLSLPQDELAKVNNLPVETPSQRMNRELAESMQEEKPHVVARSPQTAEEWEKEHYVKPKVNGHKVIAEKTESGKPKNQLAIWREMEHECGRLINRTDELNRQCPNAGLHNDVIHIWKRGLEKLKQWKALV